MDHLRIIVHVNKLIGDSMTLPTINVLAVVLATVAAFVVGFVWFGPKTFFPIWWRSLGKTGDPGDGGNMGLVFGLTILGSVVQAVALSFVIGWAQLAGNDVTWLTGAVFGLIIGVGIAAASSLGHRLFAGQGFVVWLIEAGGDIAALTVMGAVIGAVIA
jgi:hypothetical protein